MDEEATVNGSPATPWLVQTPILELLPHIRVNPEKTLSEIINAFRSQRNMPPISQDLYPSALVHVRIEVIGRGSPKDMAYIYGLSAEEREAWLDAEDTQTVSCRSAELIVARRSQAGPQRASRVCDDGQL
jgi:ribonuclease P/MRP protein subunit POP1